MKKRVFCIVLLLAVVAGSVALALSAETRPEPIGRYTEISTIGAGLLISGGVAYSDGQVTPKNSGVNSTITVRLQKWTGSGWETKGTWYGSGSTKAGASAKGSKSIDPGTYRTWVTGTCGSETAQKYSAERNY